MHHKNYNNLQVTSKIQQIFIYKKVYKANQLIAVAESESTESYK